MTQVIKGSIAPDFELKNQNGISIKLSDYRGRKLLIYFYPKALTPGCTTQSCAVSDAKTQLKEKGVDVLGISPDLPEKQMKFDLKHNLGFPLLSDPEHKVAVAYGVWCEKSMYGKQFMGIVRSSFLVDEKGKIISAWYKVSPKDTVPNAEREL
jgi:thioredoxin-dependent peroxiredoxin